MQAIPTSATHFLVAWSVLNKEQSSSQLSSGLPPGVL